ncbi:MAG: HAMP domain-containing sensor histidine kinase [Chloroflexi bacterium]|nr:HAMP domain-containing sensor histidine kinase [Chloroflexota bacterium]
MSKLPINRLWVQLSVAFSLVILIVVLAVGAANYALRPHFDFKRPIALTTEEREQFEQMDRRFRIQGVLLLITIGGAVGISAGTLMSRRLSAPLEKLAAGTQAIGERDLSYRVSMQGSQEIRTLAESFNTMAAALQTAEMQRQNLLADVAHELRTPLTVLQGNLRAILDDVYTLDKGEVARLYDQTRHLISLVNDLHELAQAEARQLPLLMQMADVSKIVCSAADIIEPVAEVEGITLQVIVPPTPVMVQADKARLTQVLQNLLTNALRHTSQGGFIKLAVTASNSEAVVSVQDNGDGIAVEHLPHVFDRFYRSDRARARDNGGAGLGLAIVRALIEAHGGWVEAVSPGLGQGSTFRVHLPYVV